MRSLAGWIKRRSLADQPLRSNQNHAALTIVAPIREPMIPLGRRSKPSPAARLKIESAHERAHQSGDEGLAPVDPSRRTTEKQLGAGTDEHAEEDEADEQHAAEYRAGRLDSELPTRNASPNGHAARRKYCVDALPFTPVPELRYGRLTRAARRA